MNNSIFSSTIIQGSLTVAPPNGPGQGGPPPGGSPPSGPPPGGSGGGGGSTATITDLERNLTLYGYGLLFLFGYFGHINGIIIFLQHTLRAVSTSCLFICVAISDIMYLSVCIYDFLYTGIGISPVDSQTNSNVSNALCRFRSFIQSTAMCSSAWLLLAISIDRWLRIRFPFRVRELCTRKRVLFGALILLISAGALNCHLLLPSLGTLPRTNICGPITTSTYSFFFRQVWGILFTCLQSVLPTILLLIVSIDMFIRLRRQQRQRQRLNQGRRRAFIDRQMLIIMLTSIFLFFLTQIPLSLFNILLSPFLQYRLNMTQAFDLTTAFNFIASINYATTFYIHCLTSGLFRQEFYNILRRCVGVQNRRVGVVTLMIGQTTQTRMGLTHMREKRNQQEGPLETVE